MSLRTLERLARAGSRRPGPRALRALTPGKNARNFRNLLLVRVRSIFMSLGCQHQNAFSCPHISKVFGKSFGKCIPITYVPFCKGPDKSRQVLLRQAAENPEVVKDFSTSVVQDIGKSVGRNWWPWQSIENLGGSAAGVLFAAFSSFSILGQKIHRNVADIKSELADWKRELVRESKQFNARLDSRFDNDNARFDNDNARFDNFNARMDADDARFEKVYLGTVLGVPALLMIGSAWLMIGSSVLKEEGK